MNGGSCRRKAHYWARELQALGHEVRLIPPQYVKPFVKTNKNGATDAEASRAKEIADDGRMQELQDEASRIGSMFLKLSYYRIDDIAPGPASELRPLANELDLLETERL